MEVLSRDVDAYIALPAFSVLDEPGAQEHETVYRLRIHVDIPVRLSTIIGDVLHNLRSALDCIAFEFAQGTVGGELTPGQEKATSFPIVDTQADFAMFFTARRRVGLFTDRQLRAMRAVQPGRYHDAGVAAGDAEDPVYRRKDVEVDLLGVLQRLNNVDKHRRLHLTVWRPDLVWWGSEGETTSKRWVPELPPYVDGAVLGRLVDVNPSDPEPPVDLGLDIELRLDPPSPYPEDVVTAIQRVLRPRQPVGGAGGARPRDQRQRAPVMAAAVAGRRRHALTIRRC